MFFKKKAAGDEAAVAPPAPLENEKYGADEANDASADVPEGLQPTRTTATEDIVYPHGLTLVLLMSSVFISMFLVSLVSSPTSAEERCAYAGFANSLTRTVSSSQPPSPRSPTTSTP